MNRRRAFFFFILVLSGFAGTPLRAAEVVKVGVHHHPPLVYLDPKGTPRGLCIDFLQAAAQSEGWELSFFRFPSAIEGLEGLEKNTIDLVAAVSTDTRRAGIDFSRESVIVNWAQVFVPYRSTIQSFLDLEQKRIAVLQDQDVAAGFKGIMDRFDLPCQIVEVRAHHPLFELLVHGDVDAAVVDRMMGLSVQGAYPVVKTTLMFNPRPVGFAAKKADGSRLLTILDAHLARMKQTPDSVYHQAMNRWVLHESLPWVFPSWLYPMMIGTGILVMLLLAISLFSRYQVRRRTLELHHKNRELERQMRATVAAEKTLIRQNEYMAALHETTLGLIGRLELGELLETMINRAAELIGTEDGFIYLENRKAACIEMRMGSGRYKPLVGTRETGGKGVAGKVWETGEAQLIYDYADWPHGVEHQILADLHSVIASPLRSSGGTAGVIGLGYFDRERQFNREDLKIFNRFAELAAIAIDNARLHASLQKELADRRTAETFLESILNSSIDWIITTSPEGVIQYASPRATEFTGYAPRELLGANVGMLHPMGALESDEMLAFVRQKGELKNHTMRLKRKDGQFLDVSLSASRLKSHDGAISGALAIYRDLSESKRLEFQFQHAQRMEAIGTLAGGIAHNFNNLLMGIQGNISLLRLQLPPDSPQASRLELIEKNIESGSRLTRQLMGYAREGRYEVRSLDVNQLIKDMVGTFAAARKEIRLRIDLAEDLPAISADSAQMEQTLMNLFVNASDAMPNGGDLTVTTELYGDTTGDHRLLGLKYGAYVCITVQDTGIGMEKKIQERIFEPFFTTKGIDKGTGLGLASAYGIVESHGGRITVESAPGQGTTFRIFLPATLHPPRKEPQLPIEALPGKERILIVDDEPMILDVAAQMLEALGYSVQQSTSGEAAVALFAKNPGAFDLVVLDMVMPGMGGLQTFDRIREIRPDMKVLLSSGYSLDQKAGELMERGCNGFLQKPFNLSELSLKVREVIGADGPPVPSDA